MKKYIMAIAVALATTFGVSAADYAYTLVLNRTDGTKSNFLFENIPVATIDGDVLTIVENISGLSVELPISEFASFTFDKEEIPDGINNVATNDGNVTFGLSCETLDVMGLSEDVTIMIFDAAGKLRVEGRSDVNGAATLNISGLDKGVYIVKAGNNTFKFIR